MLNRIIKQNKPQKRSQSITHNDRHRAEAHAQKDTFLR